MKDNDIEKLLKALANNRRLAILKLIKRKKEVNVGTIATEIKLSFRSTSRHLKLLVLANILDREQIGLEVKYSLFNQILWRQFSLNTIGLFARISL